MTFDLFMWPERHNEKVNVPSLVVIEANLFEQEQFEKG